MTALKMVFHTWLMPLPLSLVLICAGLLFGRARRRGPARVLVVAGTILAVAATCGPVANHLLRPLETRYHGVPDASVLSPAPRYIVVLGSGYQPREGLSVTAALGSDAVIRLTEGIRLYRQIPAASLVLSGGPVGTDPPSARGYALAAVALGVPPEALILSDAALDTGAEIRAVHARVGDAPILIVTSAAHMPRAMEHCRRVGLHAVAAPTGNLTDPTGRNDPWLPFPSGSSLRKTETAFHEYFGLLALRLGIT